jgi:hypothetical protein
MHQVIGALTLMTIFISIIALGVPATVAISISSLLQPNTIAFREPDITYADGVFWLSGPFFINNTGFYDLSDLNATMLLETPDNATLSSDAKLLPILSAGSTVTSFYQLSFPLNSSDGLDEELLTRGADLSLNTSMSFTVISIITVGISSTFVVRWRAPFVNLTISSPRYDNLSEEFSFSLSFANSANFELSGVLIVDVTNNVNDLIGSTRMSVNLSSRTLFRQSFDVSINRSVITNSGTVSVYFDGVNITQKGWSLDG